MEGLSVPGLSGVVRACMRRGMVAGRGEQDWSGECRCSSTPAVLQGQVGAGALAAKEGEAADREGEGGLVMQQHLWFPKMSVHLFDCREHRTLERGTYKEMWEAISFGSLRNLVWMAQVSPSLPALHRFPSY